MKPANFLLSGQVGDGERVLLGDFGIARALDDVGLTATGSVMATIAYAAPELLSGQYFDGRADIYSLGCTLFRLLTGKTPFAGTNGPAAVMMAHLQSPPPRVTDAVASLPAALDTVIATAMAKDPSARFASASALAAAAAAALHDPTRRFHAPMAPVPSGEVSSYPRPDAYAPAVPWIQAGGPPMMTSTGPPPVITASTSVKPARQTHRGRGLLIGAVIAAVVLIGVTVAVVAWPREEAPRVQTGGASSPAPTASQGPPATDVPASALPSILLTANEIPGNTGDGAVVLEQDGTDLLSDSATIDNQDCLSAWAPAQQRVYANRGFTGAAVQVLRALYKKVWQDSVIQAVISFPTPDDAGIALQLQRQKWNDNCAGKTVTITPTGEAAQIWKFGEPTNNAGAFVIEATRVTGGGSCQHGLAAHGNVLIDIRQCRSSGPPDVGALINATANKVPRQ